MIEIRIVVAVGAEKGNGYRDTRELSGVMETVYILFGATVTSIYNIRKF